MADMHTSAPRKVRASPIRIDFTPLVDLGFLLITFFMLTTSLNQPFALPLVMPDVTSGVEEPIPESKALTLILGKNNQVFWYRGVTDPKLDSCDFSAKKDVADRFGEKIRPDGVATSSLVVLIKPTKNSVCQNVISALDEMSICGISKYALVELSEFDKGLLAMK
jgi:biopolymer transport protein ExbD